MIAAFVMSMLKTVLPGLFTWLNARVDADKQIQITHTQEAGSTGRVIIGGLGKADELNADVRKSEGKFSPWLIVTIVGFMLPFAYHTTLVVLDSCPWIPTVGVWYIIPYVEFIAHKPGSWDVKALPGLFEQTEHAVIQSLFIGAATAATGVALLKALKR